MTLALIILTILNGLAEVTELCYDAGRFTRTTILPALVYTYVVSEQVVTKIHQGLVYTYDDVMVLQMRLTPTVAGTGFVS